MNRPKPYILLLAVLCVWLSACTDSDMIPSGGAQGISGRIQLRLYLPAFTEVQTRSAEQLSISNLYLVAYTAANANGDAICCESRQITADEYQQQTDGTYQLVLDFENEVADIHLIANAESTKFMDSAAWPQENSTTKLDAVFENSIGADTPVLWGHVNVSSVKNGVATVSLLRNVAKATVQLDRTDEGDESKEVDASLKDFEISGWEIIHTAASGSITPKNYDSFSTEANCRTGETFQKDGVQIPSSSDNGMASGTTPLYFYETSADKDTRIVIEGKKGGRTRYYTALFLNSEGSSFPLLRNHHYEVTIVSVSNGYATKEEAIAAPAGNLVVDIYDHNYLISELVSNGAYDLGVCDTVRIGAEAGTYGGDKYEEEKISQLAYFVTMWGQEVNVPDNLTLTVKHETGSEWLSPESEVTKFPTYDISGSYNSPGKGYVIPYSCAANPTEKIRYGRMIVTFGELSLPIVIEQAAANLKKDRQTYIKGLPYDDQDLSYDPTNSEYKGYYDFIMEYMQGALSTEMGGKGTRSNGMHLGIGGPTGAQHNYSYKIAKNADDKAAYLDSKDEGRVEMTSDAQWYYIGASDPTDSKTWIGKFYIKNGEGNLITYDLYHTGIFQHEGGQNKKRQPTSQLRDHWYYYEVVTEKSTGVTMFDRNLGAASVDDAGGYYLLKDGDKETDIESVCPAGYTRPPLSFWESMMDEKRANGQMVTRYKADGSSYQSWEVEAKDDEIGTASIRFPCGGYCIGDEQYNSAIGYYWSTTLVSGNQGFDASSPEYGYWYRIARISTNGESVSSVRYADGSNGECNTPYRYMSVRCVRDDEALTVEKNRITVYDQRTNKSQALYIYISTDKSEYRNNRYGEKISDANNTGGPFYYDMIDPETIKTSIGKELCIRFRQGDERAENGWIGRLRLIGEDRIFYVTDNEFYPKDYNKVNNANGTVDDMGGNGSWPSDSGSSMDMNGAEWPGVGN